MRLGGMQLSPGQRLRQAREAARLTRKELGGALSKAQSTIRAHENGQNAIGPEAASEYSRQLGVSPTWLLYGEELDAPLPSIGPFDAGVVPVLGKLRHGSFSTLEQVTDQPALGELLMSIPGFEGLALAAYLDETSSDRYNRSYVITVDLGHLSSVDEFVLERRRGSLVELAVWRLLWQGDYMIFYVGDSPSTATETIQKWPGKPSDLELTIVGRVIARLTYRSSA